MRKIARDALLGGVIILLPIAMLIFFAKWLYAALSNTLLPITHFFTEYGFPQFFADVVAAIIVLLVFVVVGFGVRTKAGGWFWLWLDEFFLQRTPLYKTLKEIVKYLFGGDESGLLTKSEVVRAQIFGADVATSVTGLVTSIHEDGTRTIFVPTGPNPTSGQIFHVPAECVQVIEGATMEEMMRTIIACGAGSDKLFS